MASDIARDSPHEALARELRRVEAELGPMPPAHIRRPHPDVEGWFARRRAWDERFRSDCALLRAAFLANPAAP